MTLPTPQLGHLTWQCSRSSRYSASPQSVVYSSGGYFEGKIPFLPRLLLPGGYSARVTKGRADLYAPYLVVINATHEPPLGVGPTIEQVESFDRGVLQEVHIPGPYPVRHSPNWSRFTTTITDANVFVLPLQGGSTQRVTITVEAPEYCGGTAKLVQLTVPATSPGAHLLGLVSTPFPLPRTQSSPAVTYEANRAVFSTHLQGGPILERLSSAVLSNSNVYLWWPADPNGLRLSTTYAPTDSSDVGAVAVPAELPEPSILLYGS